MQSFLDLFADDPKKNPKCSICSDPLLATNLPTLDVAGNSLVCEKCSNTSTPDALSALKVPCKYKLFGCTRQVSLAGLPDHVKACDFRIYQCSIGSCAWQGQSAAFKIHIAESHKDLVIENGCFKIPRRDTESFNIIYACNEMFVVQFGVKTLKFYLSVKYVGKPPDCGRFTYEVSLKDANSKQGTVASIYSGKMKSFSDLSDLSGKTDIEFTITFLDQIFKSQNINCIIAIVEKEAIKNKKTKQKDEKCEKQAKASNNESKSQQKATKEKAKGKDSNKNKKDVAVSDNQKSSSSKEGNTNVKSPIIDLISDVKKPSSSKEGNTNVKSPTIDLISDDQKPSSSKLEGNIVKAALVDLLSDYQQPPSSTSEIGTLQKNLIQELECPICQEYMSAPILLCTLGHSICSECKPKLLKCPTCSSPYGNTRNYTLESMLNLIHVPCRNERYGCEFIGTAPLLQTHNSLCEYGKMKCPVPNICNWTGNVDLLNHHLQSCHEEDCYVKLDEEIVRDFKATETSYHLARFREALFRISCKLSKKKGRFATWSFEKVSSNKSDKRYLLEIEFVDQTDSRRKFVINDVCRDVNETEKIFDDALFIPLQLLKPFLDSEQSLHFRYKISVS